jgi:hypothetical protein
MKPQTPNPIQVQDIYLDPPQIQGSRMTYSWSENPLLDEKGLWIEYPGIKLSHSPTLEQMAPYLAICLTFAVLGPIRVHLPYQIPETWLKKWTRIIAETAQAVYRNKKGFKLINGTTPLQEQPWKGEKIGLLFGGGAEALLTLAQLLEEGIKPVLISFSGARWDGADPEKNPHKFELERQLCEELGLKLVSISTPFFHLIYKPEGNWKDYMSHHIKGIIHAALFIPFTLAGVFPIAHSLNLARIVNGNEKENDFAPKEYCLSKSSVQNLKDLHPSILYGTYLGKLSKSEIIKELHLKFPAIAKYQYSCLVNKNKRWCLKCEKCFRNLVGFRTLGIPLSRVGIYEEELRENLPIMIQETRSAMSENIVLSKQYDGLLEEAKKAKSGPSLQLIKSVFRRRRLLRWYRMIRPR